MDITTMSNKELGKLISYNDKYKSKLIYYNSSIYYILSIGKQYVEIENVFTGNISSIDKFSLKDYADCVTLEKIQKCKLEYKLIKVYKNNNKLLKFLGTQTIDLYGDDYVWLDSDRLTITIHYPERIIKNSAEMEHKLKDIYVRITLRPFSLSIGRATFTPEEYGYSYVHSHVSSDVRNRPNNYWTEICTGDSPLTRRISDIYSKGQLIMKDFRQFLLLIDEFLKWESVEGGPYRYIADLPKYGKSSTPISKPRYEDIYYTQIIQCLDTIDYQSVLEFGIYKIKLTESSVNLIDNMLSKLVKKTELYIRHNGNSYGGLTLQIDDKNLGYLDYGFKGRDIPIKIESDKDKVIDYEKKVHIDILKEVVLKIENNLTNHLIDYKYDRIKNNR